jgi:hypothetical protein
MHQIQITYSRQGFVVVDKESWEVYRPQRRMLPLIVEIAVVASVVFVAPFEA